MDGRVRREIDGAVRAGEDGGRRLLVSAAVGTEDRKGDVIEVDGWVLDGYRANPVFLWAHDRSLPPIGRASAVWVADGELRASVEFAPTEFAGQVWELYAAGFLRGVSVGFLPLEVEARTASDGRRGCRYVRQELLEISAVPVPMHAGALAGGDAGMRRLAADVVAEVSDAGGVGVGDGGGELGEVLAALRGFRRELLGWAG